MQVGLIAQIDGENCQVDYVVSSAGSPIKGQKCALDSGLCGHVWAEGKTIAVEDVSALEPTHAPDKILPASGSYLGARVSVSGRAYGTLCFSSELPSHLAFTPGGKAVVQLFAEWAGNEILILPDTSLALAEDLLGELREQFAIINHRCKMGEFACTFSAGLADLASYKSANALIEAADAALYRAKQTGRNKVCINDGTQPK